MAFELIDPAWQTPIEGVCKLVFLALCSRAKDHIGTKKCYDCWPSVETIAEDCGISERCARDHIKWLMGEGYITRRRRGMLTSVYCIVLEKLPGYKRKDLPVNPAEPAGHERQDLPTEPVTEPVTQPVKKPTAATPTARPVVVKEISEIPETLFAAWIAVRKTRNRKVLTTVELDEIRAEAAQAGMTLADVVRECVNSGWARFKAAWLTNKNPSAPTVPSATPVDAALLEKMATPPVAARDIPQLPPEERKALRAEIDRIKSTPVAKPKLAWAEEVIALRRAGEKISNGRLTMAMSALGLTTWKDVKCAA